MNLLATAVNGNQPNQTFVVTYTDGTTSSFTQSLSDWFTPQNYAGESKALTMPYRLLAIRSADNRTFYLYGYSFAINSAKTVKSISLPNNHNVVVLAVDVTPAQEAPAAGGEPDDEPGAGDLHLGAVGHALRYHPGGGDLLHAQRHHADDEFVPVHPGHAAADQRNDHRRSHRGRERLQQQRRHQRYLHDCSGNPDDEPGTGDLHLDAVGHALRYHPGRGDLLHAQRHHADDEFAQYSPGTPLQISATTTVEAIAVASGYSNSAVPSVPTLPQARPRSASISRRR